MSDFEALYVGLRTHLLAQTGLTALVGDRIYKKVAAQNAALPFVRFYTVAGTFDNITYSVDLDGLVSVEGWGEHDKQASDVYEIIHQSLHYEEFDVDGWNLYWCAQTRLHDLPPSIVDGKTFFRVAGDFRMRLHKV